MKRRAIPGVARKIIFDEGVDAQLQEVLAHSRETLSAFVQAAVVNRLANWESPVEFMYKKRTHRAAKHEERRKHAGVEAAGALDLTLDHPDGRPKNGPQAFTAAQWKTLWNIVSDPRTDIDNVRANLGREPTTDEEWKQIVKVMGPQKKAKNEQWPERKDD